MGCYPSGLRQMDIPAAPGWDGYECDVMAVKAVIPFSSEATEQESPSKQVLFDTAQLDNAAGAGYRLQAVFAPLKKVNGMYEPLEGVSTGLNAMCFFVRTPHASQEAVESVIYSASFNPFQDDVKLPAVYDNLKKAKETNFPVSCILTEPQKSYPYVSEHTAHLICQRPKEGAPNMGNKKYSVAVCKSDEDPTSFLANFSRKGMKIASIFRPPNFPTKEDIHFIFESAPRPYHMAHVDVDFVTSISQVNYNSYIDVIKLAATKGWQLAGIIDMLNGAVTPNGKTFTSTIRLVFQAMKGSDKSAEAEVEKAQDVQAEVSENKEDRAPEKQQEQRQPEEEPSGQATPQEEQPGADQDELLVEV